MKNNIVRISHNEKELASFDELYQAIEYIQQLEQGDLDKNRFYEGRYEVYDADRKDITDLRKFTCNKCGRVTAELWAVPNKRNYVLCDTCIDERIFDDGESEYCRDIQDTISLHDWKVENCAGCEYRERCRVTQFFKAKELARQAASMLGKLGGASRSEAKQKASRENGRKGGRPRKDKTTKAE